jgi:hypothetical protein
MRHGENYPWKKNSGKAGEGSVVCTDEAVGRDGNETDSLARERGTLR